MAAGSFRFWRVMALPAWHNDGWEAQPPDLHRLLEDERMVPADLLQRTRYTRAHPSYRVKFSHTLGHPSYRVKFSQRESRLLE
jgi:hypothetical protein